MAAAVCVARGLGGRIRRGARIFQSVLYAGWTEMIYILIALIWLAVDALVPLLICPESSK